MTKRSLATLVVAAIASAGFSAAASAAEITFTGNYGNLTGTGNGPVLGVLSLQEQGNNTYEWGFSGWSSNSGVGGTLATPGANVSHSWSDSTSQVARNAQAASGYFAQSVTDLLAAGVNQSNLALVFQVNVAGQGDTMNVRKFSVDFIAANGQLLKTLTYTPTGNATGGLLATDNGILPGVGQGSSGWLYTFDLSQIPAGFFSVGGNHIGMHVDGTDIKGQESGDLFNVNDGADNFFFTSVTAPPLVPIPAAAWTGLSALAGLGVVGKLRKKLRRD